MEKYDITKPFVLPVGMYKLNVNPSISFQLNRLVNFDLGDLDEIRKVGSQIKEQGTDHCNCGNQQVAMDMIDLWIEGLKRRDETLKRIKK